MANVVTANNLRSGAVVYLGAAGIWVENLTDAAVAGDATVLKSLEALAMRAVEQTEVTAVYAMGVRLVDGRPEPTSVRERIRAAHAPTV